MAPFILNIKGPYCQDVWGRGNKFVFLLNPRHYMDVQSYHCALMNATVRCGQEAGWASETERRISALVGSRSQGVVMAQQSDIKHSPAVYSLSTFESVV